jgi:hypothetical protein
MQIRSGGRIVSALLCAFFALLFVSASTTLLEAQTQTGTISGTATDSSGAALVGASIQVTNTGTNVTQTTVTDSEGRYSVADLSIGNYDLQASMSGFQTVLHKGVTLAVGAQPLVDFSLPVGQATQTVTVESQVSQVETQSATVSTLVNPTQLSQLPLNGRNYEQLLELAPGVQVINNGVGGGGTASSFYGAQQNFSVSGGRPEGQEFLLDNEDIGDFWGHAPGSAAIGTSLGVEALAEFQVLTNTYGAQFAGNGAVLNSASKSGSNALHGSAYEFFRNSALDSRNFFDFTSTGCTGVCGTPGAAPIIDPSQKPEFRQNQFGASVGGPIIKDKLFFFANYEGLRNATGTTLSTFVPEPYVDAGYLPASAVNPAALTPCAGPVPAPPPGTPAGAVYVGLGCGAGAQSAAAASTLAGILGLYPAPNPGATDQGGYGQYTSRNNVTQSENYFLGRIDYTLSSKDTIFGRYVSDRASQLNPDSGSIVIPDWPEQDNTANQYFTLEERRIVSANVVNLIRFNVTRTYETAVTTTAPNPILQFVADFPDGSITPGCPGCGGIGANTALPYDLAQNKIGGGDDLVWTHGAHSFKIGVNIARVQSNLSAPFVNGGSVAFLTEQLFLQGEPFEFLGTYPGHNDSDRHFREIDYAPYFEDDWKATSRLTFNLGIRYDFATNPTGGPLNTITNPPFADTRPYFTDVAGVAYSNGFTPVSHVFAANPNALNFEPRIGVAFDPFSDHKTSIRAGFGIFHDQVAPRTYASDYYLAPPYASALNVQFGFPFGPPGSSFLPFPNPFPGFVSGGPTGAITEFAGVDYNTSNSPYQMQYNLTLQRQITAGTVVSVGYIGSQGRNLFTEVDLNPPECNTATPGVYTVQCSSPAANFTTGGVQNPRINPDINPSTGAPYFSSLNTAVPQQTANYNSLQIAVTHQVGRSFSGQISYTYSKCLTTGSASSGLEQDVYEQADPYNRFYDYGLCSFDIRHAFVANGVYSLPFRGNRLVSGWQVASIIRANTGLPITIQEGADITDLGGIQGDRPNYSGTCPGGRDQVLGKWYNWFNSSCYSAQAFGSLGNVPRSSVEGPDFFNLDFSLIKNTKLWERLDTQFRAEFFNVLNHTNFAEPTALGVIVANPVGPGYVAAPTGELGDSGAVAATANTSRQIQFALKFTF